MEGKEEEEEEGDNSHWLVHSPSSPKELGSQFRPLIQWQGLKDLSDHLLPQDVQAAGTWRCQALPRHSDIGWRRPNLYLNHQAKMGPTSPCF